MLLAVSWIFIFFFSFFSRGDAVLLNLKLKCRSWSWSSFKKIMKSTWAYSLHLFVQNYSAVPRWHRSGNWIEKTNTVKHNVIKKKSLRKIYTLGINVDLQPDNTIILRSPKFVIKFLLFLDRIIKWIIPEFHIKVLKKFIVQSISISFSIKAKASITVTQNNQ